VLPRIHRLRRSADFQRVVRRGRRASSATVVLHGCPASSRSEPVQVGFVVSKSIGNAATRNLVKRRLREAVRDRIDAVPGHLLVVRANPAAAYADFRQLSADLDRCLSAMATAEDDKRARR
jgi:ribonuclease P protein component